MLDVAEHGHGGEGTGLLSGHCSIVISVCLSRPDSSLAKVGQFSLKVGKYYSLFSVAVCYARVVL